MGADLGRSGVPTVRRVAGGLVVCLGSLVSAATLAGLLGSAWWPLDLPSNFRPHFLVVLAGCAVLAGVLGRRIPAVVFLAGAVVNLALVGPYLWGSGPVPGDGARLEVVSFNVGISNPARGDVMQWLAGEDPDVIFLFESSFEWEDSARFAGIPYQMVAVVPPGRLAGVTVMARPGLARLVDTSFDSSSAAAIEVGLGEDRVTILGLHPPSPTTGARSAARNRLLTDAGEWVSTRSGPVLVIGDLNATPWSTGIRSLRWNGRLVDSLLGWGLQPTWPDGWGPLMITIDNALHSLDLATVDRRTGPALGSDHRPLIVTVTRSAAA